MRRPHCDEHPEVPAVARCSSCGRYLCRECVREVSARAYCPGCAAAAQAEKDLSSPGRGEGDAQGPPSSPERVTPAQAPPPQGPPPPAYPSEQAPPTGFVPGQVPGGPVGARMVATCAYHPGVRAVTRCSQCGAFICSGCLRVVGKRSLCEGCFRRAYERARLGPQGMGGVMRGREEPSFAAAGWKLWPGLAFLPVPFILSGVMTYMMRQGDDISVGAAQLLISLLLYSSMLFFAFIDVSRYGPALEGVGLHDRNLPASFGLGFLGGSLTFWLGTAGVFLSYALLNRLEWFERWLQGFFDVNVKNVTGLDMLIVGLVVVVAAPICEEIFFRGYLYPAMRRRLSLWAAVLLNAFLFSLVHFSILGLLSRTLAGIVFCLLYEYNDNLASPIFAHAINNFVAFFLPLAAIWST